MAQSPKPPMFNSLELQKRHPSAFWASVGVHVVLLSVLILIPLLLTETLNLRPFDMVLLVPPPQPRAILEVTPYRLPPPPKVERPERLVAPPPSKPAVTQPRRPEPDIQKIEEKPIPPKPKLVESALNGPDLPKPPAPKAEVRTGAFSTGSSAKATVNLPAKDVQTGGFGDPNGVRGQGRPDKVANVASLGSFDLPSGPGAGNGTGGAKGTRGVVASTGFGNGVATVGNGGSGDGGSRAVRQGGFGDSQPAAPAQQRREQAAATETPVEITFKPRPDYTTEARQKRVEGEVVLRIAFGANGQVRVLDTLRGLGFGLEETARRAAQQIRFKPAMRDGKPVDSVATVHIVFQLAY